MSDREAFEKWWFRDGPNSCRSELDTREKCQFDWDWETWQAALAHVRREEVEPLREALRDFIDVADDARRFPDRDFTGNLRLRTIQARQALAATEVKP